MIEMRKELNGLKPYAMSSQTRKEPVRLDLNENLFGPSPLVSDLIKTLKPKLLSQYPNYVDTNNAIANIFNVEPNELLLVNGLDDGIKLICEAFINTDDRVLIPTPTFSMYKHYATIMGGKITEVGMNSDFSFSVNQIALQLEAGAKIIFLCTPNNPTGTTLDSSVVLKWLYQYPSTLFVLDEAYVEFQGFTFLGKIKQFSNLLVLRTLSKAYGLAGLRSGIIFGNADLILKLKIVNPPFSVNTIVSCIIPQVLEDQKSLNDYIGKVTSNRRWLVEQLTSRGLEVFEGKANFLLAKFGKVNKFISRSLKQKRILVRNQDHNEELTGWSRITIGPKSMLKQFLSELDAILATPVLLFDMDGVLIDVTNSYYKTIQQTVEYFSGKKCSRMEIDELKKIIGYNNDWDTTLRLLQNQQVDVLKEEVVEKFQQIYLGDKYNGNILEETLIVEHALLGRLADKYRLGIVTGRPRNEAFFALESFELDQYFSSIITLDDVTKDKPNPEGINIALRQLKATGGYYFGDTVNDVQAAKRANLEPIGISQSNAGNLLKKGAQMVLESINSLEVVL